jgi:hypothetical protein
VFSRSSDTRTATPIFAPIPGTVKYFFAMDLQKSIFKKTPAAKNNILQNYEFNAFDFLTLK